MAQNCPMHSGPALGNGMARPIFCFKFDPGAPSQMPEDQFGPLKPSISTYGYFAVAWERGRRQENWLNFSIKNLLTFWLITHTRIHIFWTSWCHMKAVIYGYLAKVKKLNFDGVWGPLQSNFTRKSLKIQGKPTLKPQN